MKQRIISAFIGVIVLLAVMAGNQLVFDIAVVVISSMAIFEVMGALGLNDCKIMTSISLLMPLFMLATSYIGLEYAGGTIFLFLAAFLLVMLFDNERYSFEKVTKFMTVSLMISLSFVHISMVRRMDYGVLLVFVIFIGSWITDTCAYFTGIAIGKHKLAPKISPKKTIEGSIGGIVGITVILAVYTYICAKIMGDIRVNMPVVIVIGILCGILSQFGDLCASIIKRENNIKDFGNIMPGHGGVMDRFDSLIFVAPVIYYILKFSDIFIR